MQRKFLSHLVDVIALFSSEGQAHVVFKIILTQKARFLSRNIRLTIEYTDHEYWVHKIHGNEFILSINSLSIIPRQV